MKIHRGCSSILVFVSLIKGWFDPNTLNISNIKHIAIKYEIKSELSKSHFQMSKLLPEIPQSLLLHLQEKNKTYTAQVGIQNTLAADRQ